MRFIRLVVFWAVAISPLTSAPQYTFEARLLPDYTFLVAVRVNGAGPFWCNFDTGGGNVISLDSALAAKAGFHPTGSGFSAGQGAAVVPDQRLIGATLEIGHLNIPNRTVVLRPMGSDAPFDCVFGTPILSAFVVELDFVSPAVRLYNAAGFQPAPRAVSVPVTLENGNAIVSGLIVLPPDNRIDVRLAVDTGASQWPLLLSKRFVDEHNILGRLSRITAPSFQATGVGGSIALLATRADSLSLARFDVPSPVTMLFRTESGVSLPWDGLLGDEFLRRFILTIDYPNRRLFLEPNRNYNAPPQPYDGSGLWIRGSPGNFTIANVLPESPGALAGLEKGDELLSLDGIASADLSIFHIHEKLYHSAGKCAVRVQRHDKQWSTLIDLKPLL